MIPKTARYINYEKIFNKHMMNMLKEILKEIEEYGVHEDHDLYLTFIKDFTNNLLPNFLKKLDTHELIVNIKNEYRNLRNSKNGFFIEVIVDKKWQSIFIDYKSIIEIKDKKSGFYLKIKIQDKIIENKKINKKPKIITLENNIILFPKVKKEH
jgi:hypothetical protein